MAILLSYSIISCFANESIPHPETVAMEDSISAIYNHIIGSYDPIASGPREHSELFQQGIFYLEEVPTDETKYIWMSPIHGINYGNVTPELSNIRDPWLCMTYNIELCNNFITQDFNIPYIVNETIRSNAVQKKDEYDRQAKIIRSAMYYYLVNEYGNVPYWDETMDSNVTPQQLSTDMATGRRMVTEKVINTLENLVEWYKTNDPDNKPSYGRVGLDVAESLLVKFYLNHEVFTGQPAWDKTLAHAESIIERRGKGGFQNSGLAMNYSQNFSYNSDVAADNEIIWRIGTKDLGKMEVIEHNNGDSMLLLYAGRGSSWPVADFIEDWNESNFNCNGGWKCMVGLRQLTNAFEWNYETKESPDQRVAWWGTAKHGFKVDNYSLIGDDWGNNGFIPIKFTNWNINDDGSKWSEPWRQFCTIDYGMIRLAEIYLSAAEAILNCGGDLDKALRYTNYIRQRAGMPAFTSLDMETLRMERQRELYTECNRRTDLIRYGKWISGYNWDWKGGARKGRDFDPNFIVYPIPSSVVDKYGYTQNPLPHQYEVDPVDIMPADWKIIGTFCDFDPAKAISLLPNGDGSYELTLSELEGSFSFITADPWDDSQLWNGDLHNNLNGNVNINLASSGDYIKTEGKLHNVKLLLYPYANVLSVTGLDNNQSYSISSDQPVDLYLAKDGKYYESNKMTYEGDGIYSLKAAKLSGQFVFSDGRSHFFAPKRKDNTYNIEGNCTLPVVDNISLLSFNAPEDLYNVEILLDTHQNTVTFSGLNNIQNIPEYDPNVESYGCYLLNQNLNEIESDSWDIENFIKSHSDNTWDFNLMHIQSGLYISKANLVPGIPLSWKRNIILKYLYGADDAFRILSDGSKITLDNSLESLSSGWFEFDKEGCFHLIIDTDADILTVEEIDTPVYIVGQIYSENGVYNGFLPPTKNYREVYTREFTLHKNGDVYEGRFRLADADQLNTNIMPEFRFLTELRGWTAGKPFLGSAKDDFYCMPVDTYYEYDLIEGMGNFGIDAPGKWINIALDLERMKVKFEIEGIESGVSEIQQDNMHITPKWYNMQGIKVNNPTKGLYIKVTGNKKEKVIL